MSWNSKSGQVLDINNNDNYMNHIMKCLNTRFGKTTTYKYALIKSILDNLFNINENFELSYKEISVTFSKLYWNLVSIYKLPQKIPSSQGNKSSIEIIIDKICKKYNYIEGIDYDSLDDSIKKEFLNLSYFLIEKDVVGALYSDFDGFIYGFSKKQKKIFFSEASYDFLLKNKTVIEKLNYYFWIIWIETVLEKDEIVKTNIGIKLDNSTKRKNLNIFKNKLLTLEQNKCFYCGKDISNGILHIDHFIPWSFVKDDKIWNLVPSCKKCNLNKKDKIPSNFYLEKIIKRNYDFLDTDSENLKRLYKSSIYNGFIVWENKYE